MKTEKIKNILRGIIRIKHEQSNFNFIVTMFLIFFCTEVEYDAWYKYIFPIFVLMAMVVSNSHARKTDRMYDIVLRSIYEEEEDEEDEEDEEENN